METQNYRPENLILNHKSGSKSSQSQTFSLTEKKEILIGRSNQADVAYDPTSDTVVSRQHATISVDPNNLGQYTITDMASSNGTFVNGKKLQGSMAISHGDTISLGENGPSFSLSFDPPPPDNYAGATRIINVQEEAAATKVMSSKEVFGETAEKVAEKTTVGKETVERMVASAQTKQKNNFMYIIGAIALLAALGIGYMMFFGEKEPVDLTRTPDQIMASNKDKVVYIDIAWKLTYTKTGGEVYHQFIPVKDEKTGKINIYPRYVQVSDGSIEPALTTEGGTSNPLIGSAGSGTGFLISGNGHILTNRHVAAAWGTRYRFPQGSFPGVMAEFKDGKWNVTHTVDEQAVAGWVPENSKQTNTHWSSPRDLVGVNSRLNVVFADKKQPTVARLTRVSQVHDVAMISIDLPRMQDAIPLSDQVPEPKPGERVVAIGYPGASFKEYSVDESQDIFNKSTNVAIIPNPSVSAGVISKIITTRESKESEQILNMYGDYYEVDINIGGGNSGGPMFNDKGELVGIVSGGTNPGSDYSYGLIIPIKYGIKLVE